METSKISGLIKDAITEANNWIYGILNILEIVGSKTKWTKNLTILCPFVFLLETQKTEKRTIQILFIPKFVIVLNLSNDNHP